MKTLHQHHEDFVESQKLANHSPLYQRALRYHGQRTLRWLSERYRVTRPEELTREHLEAWVRHIQASKTGKGLPLRPTSIAKQLDTDRVFFLWLATNGFVSATLPAALPRIKLPDVLPTSVLNHRQMMRLIAAVNRTTDEGVQLYAMLEFLYSSGVRVAELLGLDLEKVDLSNRQAIIWGKGSKERVVVFGESAARALETYIRAFRSLNCHDPAERAVWLDAQGHRMPYHTFRRQLQAVAERVGLTIKVSPHTFRRSFATEMVRSGANLWLIKTQMGQASIEALKPYIKLTIPDLKKTHAKCHPREKDHR